LFDITYEHADGEDVVNISNDMNKPCSNSNASTSSPRKKDCKHKGYFVGNIKKGGGDKQKQNKWDKFNNIMNNPCQNHGFWVTHLAKDCHMYRK